MPQRNHCRDALVQHCLWHAHDNVEQATALLDDIVRRQVDFMVPWACVPKNGVKTMTVRKYIDSRFSAQTWMDTHVKRYGIPSTVTYAQLVAEAYLHTPGLELPDDTWTSASFVDTFRAVASDLLSLRVPPSKHNLERARQHRVAGPIVVELEAQYPAEVARLLQLYDALLESLHTQGIPPANVIERLMGRETADSCLVAIETLETSPNDLDVDAALEAGRRRQQQSDKHAWDRVSCARAVALLELYCAGVTRGSSHISIGEEYDRYRKAQTTQYREHHQDRIERAQQVGVWRIRRAEIDKWRQTLSDNEWKAYQQCELLMCNVLSVGVYSAIPRRYWNKKSLAHMRASNLPTLIATFLS